MISHFRALVGKYRNRPICNLYGSKFDKKVLISYITYPFRKDSLSHSNYYEVKSAAKIFHQLGYRVDIIHYENAIVELSKYSIIYGFGDVFKKYFEDIKSKNTLTIYYGAGMHVSHQNNASLQRVKDVFDKKGVWLAKSARFVEKTWTHQTCLVDGIIALGNEVCKASYQKFYKGPIYSVPAPYFDVLDAEEIIQHRLPDASKHFLWFGSSGLIHKGLDICLDYFKSRPDLNLHVCGNVSWEEEFVNTYRRELFELPNIHCYGFVDITSDEFSKILRKCSFAVFPSCSEGGSPSVLTVIGNGGLIPVITREATISTDNEIFIDGFDCTDLHKAIEYTQSLTHEYIHELQIKNYQSVAKNNSKQNYYSCLKKSIEKIIYSYEM